VTVLSGQTIQRLGILDPCAERTSEHGLTYGLSPAGYDLRIDLGDGLSAREIAPSEFVLAATLECFSMPADVLGVVHDKSTWARSGLCVQNTVIEPGWRGYLTLELTNHSSTPITVVQGAAIAQVVFHRLDEPTERPYAGKYQDQEPGPQGPRS
jgi:dCTP deaminase